MDFTGVFDFQLFLYRNIGWPKNDTEQWKIDRPDKMHNFLSAVRDAGLAGRLNIDIGGDAACFDGVEQRGEELIIGCCGNSDVEGFSRLQMIPDRLEILVDKDPRSSYLALVPEYHMDIDGMPQSRAKCALFYPDGSLLMTKKHRANVLANLGLGQPSFEDEQLPDDFSKDYINGVKKLIGERVFPHLERHYTDIRLSNLEISFKAPADYSFGKVSTMSDEGVVSFRVDVSKNKEIKARDVDKWVQEFMGKELPFYVIQSHSRRSNNQVYVQVLVDLPQSF